MDTRFTPAPPYAYEDTAAARRERKAAHDAATGNDEGCDPECWGDAEADFLPGVTLPPSAAAEEVILCAVTRLGLFASCFLTGFCLAMDSAETATWGIASAGAFLVAISLERSWRR